MNPIECIESFYLLCCVGDILPSLDPNFRFPSPDSPRIMLVSPPRSSDFSLASASDSPQSSPDSLSELFLSVPTGCGNENRASHSKRTQRSSSLPGTSSSHLHASPVHPQSPSPKKNRSSSPSHEIPIPDEKSLPSIESPPSSPLVCPSAQEAESLLAGSFFSQELFLGESHEDNSDILATSPAISVNQDLLPSDHPENDQPHSDQSESVKSSNGQPRSDHQNSDQPHACDNPQSDHQSMLGSRPVDKPSNDHRENGQPVDDHTSGDQSSGEQPSGGQPSSDQPSDDQPSGDQSSVSQPSDDHPSGDCDQPSGDQPSGDQPSDHQPQCDQPSSDESIIDAQVDMPLSSSPNNIATPSCDQLAKNVVEDSAEPTCLSSPPHSSVPTNESFSDQQSIQTDISTNTSSATSLNTRMFSRFAIERFELVFVFSCNTGCVKSPQPTMVAT